MVPNWGAPLRVRAVYRARQRPDDHGSALRVGGVGGRRLSSSQVEVRAWRFCSRSVVSLRFSCAVCGQRSGRVYLCASSSPGVVGADEEKADSPSLPQMNKGQSGLVLVRVVVVLIIPILCPCPRPPTPTQHHAAARGHKSMFDGSVV